jgi:asparagine synthase (glutamine-hydrolysing)
MCGIFGIIDLENKIDLKKKLIHFSEKLVHRGPDFQSHWISSNKKIGFGHCRLSIVDLDQRSNQPFLFQENLVLTFNGEIYNFKQLRFILEKKGYQFKTFSDTEVLLFSYREWKEKILDYLDGMFAFAIYDKKKDKIFLARDRSGQKPLYFSNQNGLFIFSSEIGPILSSNLAKNKINIPALNNYLSMGYSAKDETLVEGINKLDPGTSIEFSINKNRLTKKKYFSYSYDEFIKTGWGRDETFLVKILKENLTMSCEKILNADVPVALLLSGGLDSSIITGIYSKILGKKVNTYNISFENHNELDDKFACKVSKYFNTSHKKISIKLNENVDVIDEIIQNFSTEPFGDSSLIPSYLVYKELSKNFKVAIGGDGADELFGGYKHVQRYMCQGIFKFGLNKYSKLNKYKNIIKNKFARGLLSEKNYFPFEANFFSYLDRKKLFKNESIVTSESIFNEIQIKNSSLDLKNYLTYDFNYYLPNNILPKIDTASMMNSVEARSPFLSRDMINISLMMENKFKLNLFDRKIILKKFGKTILPPDFNYDRKQGFSLPISHYFNSNWKDYFLSTFEKNEARELYNENYLRTLTQKNEKKPQFGEQMYLLLIFEKWRQKYKLEIDI